MSAVQDLRGELASLVRVADLGVDVYDYLPGAAQLPAVVIGLPDRTDPTRTTGFREVELPVYVLTRSIDPKAGEIALLDLVDQVVQILKGQQRGDYYSSLRVDSTSDYYQIAVGTIEADSAQINVAAMIPA